MTDLHGRFEAFRTRALASARCPAPEPEGAPPAARPLPAGLWSAVPTAQGEVPARDDHRPLAFAAELQGEWPERVAGAALGAPAGWRFLDLETTGLVGARAFLAGVGRLEGGGMSVRQLLLEDLDREPAFLSAVAAELDGATALVTFNGKSFDVPLLRDRVRIARQADLPPMAHWDVLHSARRLWGELLGGADLRRLQAEVIGDPRHGDIPGEAIPGLYRDWLEGDAGALDGVCLHNREDMFALGGVAARLCAALSDGVREGLAPAALRGLARSYERAGAPDAAVAGHLAAGGRAGLLRAAALLKRSGRPEEAVPLWEGESRAAVPSLDAAVELAKHLEHRRRDPAAALAVVREAMRAVPWVAAERRAELEHRMRRLLRKAGEADRRAGAGPARGDGHAGARPGLGEPGGGAVP